MRKNLVAVLLSLLLALSMTPVFDVQSAFADEPAERPATTGGDVPLEGPAEGTGLGAEGNAEEADGPVTATVREDGSLVAEGLVYKSESNGAVLIGFENGNALEREIIVPEKLTDGALEYTVKGVGIAEGQSAPGVLSLELPQTVEDVDTKSLAAAMPALARVSVDGRGGEYSSANGMLFRQEAITASSDGSTTRIANRELVWAPPAMVIARIPGTCKTVAPGAFTDDRALETVMVFSIVDSVAKAEKDEGGNTTKEGAFTDEQVSRVNIVTPMETLVYPEGDRISTDAFLAEDAPLNEKHTPWCDCGFSMDRFTVGIPYGSTSLAVAVPEDGKAGTPEITIGKYTDHPEWDPKGDTGEPENGLVFEYKADMTVSVSWKGDKNAIPSHLELPAYVVENGVKTAVTEVAPNAFEGATQLESVVIPEGITAIGESAFAGCANLVGASFPSTLSSINLAVFDGTGVVAPTLPIGAPGQKASLAMSVNSDGESGRAAEAFGPVESPVSVPDALSGTEGEGVSSGDNVLTPSNNGSITSYSTTLPSTRLSDQLDITFMFAPGQPNIWLCRGATTTWSDSQRLKVKFDQNVKTVDSLIYYSSASSNSLYIQAFSADSSDPYSTGTSIPSSLEIRPPTGYVFVSCQLSSTLNPSFTASVVLARNEAIGANELALASHNHDTYYTKLDASNLDNASNSKAWRDALTVGTSALGNTVGYTNLWESVDSLKTLAEGKASRDHTHSDYLTGTASGNTLTLRKQTTSGTQLADVYTTGGTYSKNEVNNLLGSGVTTSNTVTSQLAGKADKGHTHNSYLTGSVNASNGVITLSNNETSGKFSQTTYTKRQIDTLLNGKQNTIPGGTYAASEHSHDNAYTKKDATNLDDSNKTAWRTALTVGSSGDAAKADSTTSAWARIKANADSLSALSGKVSALEGTVGSTGTDLSGRLSTAESELAALKETVGDNSKGLVQKTNANATDIGNLKTTVGTHTTDITDLKDTVGDANGGLVKMIADNKTTSDNKNKEQDTEISNIKATLDGVEHVGTAITNAVNEVKSQLEDYVKREDVVSVAFEGLDGAESSYPLPTSYVKGQTAALSLPAPSREGWAFQGWKLGDTTYAVENGAASIPGDAIATAASNGKVTVAAQWSQVAAQAGWFFTDGSPYSTTAGGNQTHTIAVKLASDDSLVGKTVKVTFAANESASVLKDASGVRFAVAGDYASVGDPSLAFGEQSGGVEVKQLEGGGCGVYVKVLVPAGAIGGVPASYTPGSYVASFAKMTYETVA